MTCPRRGRRIRGTSVLQSGSVDLVYHIGFFFVTSVGYWGYNVNIHSFIEPRSIPPRRPLKKAPG